MSRELHSSVPAVVTRTQPKTAQSAPLHYISGASVRGSQGAIYHRTLRSVSVGGVVGGSHGTVAMQPLPALRPHAAKLRIRAPVIRLWWLPPLRWVFNPEGTTSVLWLWCQPQSELQGLCTVERGEGSRSEASA
jgi:hypothetical protein